MHAHYFTLIKLNLYSFYIATVSFSLLLILLRHHSSQGQTLSSLQQMWDNGDSEAPGVS